MRSRSPAWSLLLLLCACGAPPEPGTSPPSSAAAAREPAPDASAAEAKPPAAAADASSTPASEQDVATILQLVVDDPELDNYLHLGQPGRFPLQLAGERLPVGLKLTKSTEPVKIVDGPRSKKDAVLVITEVDIQGSNASVRYRYDIENIRGNVTLAKTSHGWELKNSRLVER
jgi:hypothetical protein